MCWLQVIKGPVLATMLCAFPCCCFGFTSARCLLFQVLFWWQTKASEFSTSQKWLPRDRSVQCLMGNTGSLNTAVPLLGGRVAEWSEDQTRNQVVPG